MCNSPDLEATVSMPGETLDYYLLTHPDAVLVEEFTRAADGCATGLRSAVWSHSGWRAAASFSRLLRTDKAQLSRLTPVSRHTAAETFRAFGGGALPSEQDLRAEFADFEPFATAPPLRLGPDDTTRLYRVLFAFAEEPLNPPATLTSGHRQVNDDLFSWKLRRVGNGLGWALDVTARLATAADDTVAPLLRELTTAVRNHGLIPITTERFS
jgi:hypothetical protein